MYSSFYIKLQFSFVILYQLNFIKFKYLESNEEDKKIQDFLKFIDSEISKFSKMNDNYYRNLIDIYGCLK